jgi:L-ascorbate metabolism protein UlaG (beta-lactamase superfamily)
MKVTKFVHACLLVESDEATVLFDPGIFTLQSGLLDVESLKKLDYIVITHEHVDHFNLPLVAALVKKFPLVTVVTTDFVANILKEQGIRNVVTKSIGPIEIFSKKLHAELKPFGQAPQNIAVHFAGRLTVGGDRHDLEESKEILALTMTGPWGSMMGAAQMAVDLKSKILLPIHDWHWNDQAREQAYQTFESFFSQRGTKFVKLVDRQAIEL